MGINSCGDDHLLLLPEDFLIQILLWLPVKSLLRFKTVSKTWLKLIETPFFIDLHTTTTTCSNKFGAFILQTIEASDEKFESDLKLYMLSSSSGSGNGDHGDGEDDNNEEDDDDQKKKMVFKLDEDLGFSAIYKDFELKDSLRMVGSCNGIICLQDPKLTDPFKRRRHYLNLRDVSLYNPATRQFRILPKSIPPPIQQGNNKNIHRLGDFIGFGYDVKTKDYKVLRITPLDDLELEDEEEGRGCICQVQVYSLSTNSWRLLEGINSLPCLPNQNLFLNSGIYLNGSYFFVGEKSKTEFCHFMLLSFDFTKEIFTTMQLPDNNSSRVLSSLGDKLAVFTYGIDDYDYYDIWVLLNEQQHGSRQGVVNNENSWTKLHSFRSESSSSSSSSREPSETEPSDSDDDTQPRCISNNGEFALISTGWNKLQLLNLITKEAKKDFTISIRGECRANVYKESLVSIMGGGGGGGNNNVLLRWQLPSHGTTYRLSWDAPCFQDDYSYGPLGIGLCLTTSDTGGCIGVRSLRRSVRDAELGEALVMLEAIKWAQKLELSPIIIESNSKNCVSFFMDDDDDDDNSTYWSSGAISLLREAKILLLNSSELGTSISFQYCSRSSNYVADIAAKLARDGVSWDCMDGVPWDCKEWTANSPGEIVMSLSKDLGLETTNYWVSDSGLEAENYWASDTVVETDNYWGFDSGVKTEKGWASDSGLETEKGWASNSGLETDKGWASE